MHAATQRTARVLVLALATFGAGFWLLRWTTSLPIYDVLLEGGYSEFLDGEHVPQLHPGTRLSIALRPHHAVHQRVFVRAHIGQGAAQPALWPVFFEQTEHGTLRLQGTARELLPAARGRVALTFYLSHHPLPWGIVSPSVQGWLLRLLPRVQVVRAEVQIDGA